MSYAAKSSRFLDNKVYVSPVESPEHHVQAKRSRCHFFQIILCLLGISILAMLGGRCLFRMAHKEKFIEQKPIQQDLQDFAKLTEEFSEEFFEEFESFIQTYNKKYSSIREHWKRFTIFSKNLKEIRHKQGKVNNTFFDAQTPFADLDDEELKRMLMPYTEAPRSANIPRFDTSPGWTSPEFGRPASFDWRQKGAVLGIKDQGQCGSCWAFASVAVVESMHIINGGNRTKLSEQELLDCDLKDNACGGGYRPYAFQFVKQKGLVEEDSYEYTARRGECQLPPSSQNKTRVFVDEVYGFDPNELDMADWVATKGPITIGVNVTKGMFNYRSGVLSPTPYECAYESLGSHAMAVIGYGSLNGEDYWLLKNSWGVVYGQAGYLKMRRGVNSCGIANNAYTALITKPHN